MRFGHRFGYRRDDIHGCDRIAEHLSRRWRLLGCASNRLGNSDGQSVRSRSADPSRRDLFRQSNPMISDVPATRQQQWKRYSDSQRSELKAKARARYIANPEKYRTLRREYTKRNPDIIRAYKRKPEVKAREMQRVRRNRANWTPEQKAHAALVLRSSHLRRLYGITAEQFDAMALAQGGVCGICGKPDANKRWKGRLHVDHCHKTGKVRGLLCTSCNLTLGRIGESIGTALALIDYLRKHAP